ncbi:MAG: 4-hydroxy-3-methylbut-2-enyl diphosphate reductase [Bacteroidales bacterium]|nr:4-hydroxy-3-methylbut-2-enyl diphosphate reductase [Bacteroidales bacterium]
MTTIIERQAGFCFGVVRAITASERELQKSNQLYCIGDIVHNNMEVSRLEAMGLKTVTLEEFNRLHDCKVMIRAHGEPPQTYLTAKKNNISLIDATCPIVLKLQKEVLNAYGKLKKAGGQIIIFGKAGHAEVVGLEGQTENTAVVISSPSDLDKINMEKPLHIFSQTTKNKQDYENIISLIKQRHKTGEIFVTDSICKKVSLRAEKIGQFAKSMDCVLFVSGKHSSNGQYLFNLCKQHNDNTFLISAQEDIDIEKIKHFNTIGISGATSTPMWLMKKIEEYVHQKIDSE